MKNILYYLWISVLLVALPLGHAKAYLDPGNGSYIIQVVIGLLLGGSFIIRGFWSNITVKVKSLLGKKRKVEVAPRKK